MKANIASVWSDNADGGMFRLPDSTGDANPDFLTEHQSLSFHSPLLPLNEIQVQLSSEGERLGLLTASDGGWIAASQTLERTPPAACWTSAALP